MFPDHLRVTAWPNHIAMSHSSGIGVIHPQVKGNRMIGKLIREVFQGSGFLMESSSDGV